MLQPGGSLDITPRNPQEMYLLSAEQNQYHAYPDINPVWISVNNQGIRYLYGGQQFSTANVAGSSPSLWKCELRHGSRRVCEWPKVTNVAYPTCTPIPAMYLRKSGDYAFQFDTEYMVNSDFYYTLLITDVNFYENRPSISNGATVPIRVDRIVLRQAVECDLIRECYNTPAVNPLFDGKDAVGVEVSGVQGFLAELINGVYTCHIRRVAKCPPGFVSVSESTYETVQIMTQLESGQDCWVLDPDRFCGESSYLDFDVRVSRSCAVAVYPDRVTMECYVPITGQSQNGGIIPASSVAGYKRCCDGFAQSCDPVLGWDQGNRPSVNFGGGSIWFRLTLFNDSIWSGGVASNVVTSGYSPTAWGTAYDAYFADGIQLPSLGSEVSTHYNGRLCYKQNTSGMCLSSTCYIGGNTTCPFASAVTARQGTLVSQAAASTVSMRIVEIV